MDLRLKVLLLAVAPLLVAIAAIAAVVQVETRALADAETQAAFPVLESARRAELRHYLDLALGSIEHLHDVADQDEARREALSILLQLDFGEDGYFYVYDINGRNLMHPRLPELVGRDLWDLRDERGTPTIQRLIAKAREGGGYVEFDWNRPSTGRTERKLGYVALEPKWGWMIGTGVYMDDLESARAHVDMAAATAISATMRLIVVIAGLAVLIVAGCGLALNLSTQRIADARMRALAHQVVVSQEHERARVASELHDGVSQLLVSAKFMFESAQERLKGNPDDPPHAAAGVVAQGVARLNEVLREIRRISHGLRPTALDDLGLPAALSQMLNEFGARTGVVVNFKAGQQQALPETVATALFRVTQEALNNIERHAGASSVTISLTVLAQSIRLSITDDGHGFNLEEVTAQPRSGLGLSSMRERIETLGGMFVMHSGPEGTSIEVIMPPDALKS